MSESKKCFCDLYRQASAGEVSEIPIGPTTEVATAEEFVEDADRTCPGTTLFIGNVALRAEDVTIDADSITLPKDAVELQCEYFYTRYIGM